MSVRWAAGKTMVMALVAGILGAGTPCATAQRLNLDRVGSFGGGGGAEKTIELQTKDLREALKSSTDRAVQLQGAAQATLQAQNRGRELVLALLDAGGALGEAGTVHLLIGRRIAARLAELDRLFQDLGGGGEEKLTLLRTFIAECPKDDKALPRSVDDLDALLARVFGPLEASGKPVGSGWLVERVTKDLSTPEALASAIEQCKKVEGMSAEALGAMKAYGAPPQALDGLKVEPQRAAAERQLLVQAAQSVLARPKWVPAKAAQAGTAAFDGVATRLGLPEARDAAKVDLCRMALLGDVLMRIESAKLNARQTKAMRAIGVGLVQELAPGSNSCDDMLGAMRRGLAAVSAYEAARWDDNRRLVREVRPLWRDVELRGRAARDELIDSLSGLKPTSIALSDPGLLSAITALKECLDEGKRLCVVSAWLAGEALPATAGERIWLRSDVAQGDKVVEARTQKDDRIKRQAGVRLLALGQQLQGAGARDEALAPVRELGQGLSEWAPIPGEGAIRSAVAAAPDSEYGVRWRAATGGAASEIVSAIEAAREDWLQAWAAPTGVKEKPAAKGASPAMELDPNRIGVMREYVASIVAAAVLDEVAASGRGSGIRAWPGFELSDAALKGLQAPIKAELGRAGGFVVAQSYGDVEQSVAGMRTHAAVARGVAALQDWARMYNVKESGLAAELAHPPGVLPTLGEDLTPVVWLLRERESVAALCRALEEYADASGVGDKDRASAMLNRAAAEAERIESVLR